MDYLFNRNKIIKCLIMNNYHYKMIKIYNKTIIKMKKLKI